MLQTSSENKKKIYLAILSILLVAAILSFSRINSANGSISKLHGKQFDDWGVECFEEKIIDEKTKKEEVKEICLLRQNVEVKKDGNTTTLAQYQVSYLGPTKQLKFIQTFPTNVNIKSGTALILDKKIALNGEYVICTGLTCQAIINLTPENEKAILEASEIVASYITPKNERVNLPLSIKGLSKGLKALKN